jgi:D-serine deaminase-like pyridoxal phosphate-dependent protein
MDPIYAIADTSQIISPALVIYKDLLEQNLERMLAIAGGPERLRPHCKTHKMPAVTRLELARGIGKHKCATLAEAEMLAEAGVKDIFLAYNLVGPNIARTAAFRNRFPHVALLLQADHPAPIAQLGAAMRAAGHEAEVLLDLDVGQHRTGVAPGLPARELYATLARTPGLKAGGFHVYDGHQHQRSLQERAAAIDAQWVNVLALRQELEQAGLPVARIVCGGTGSFPIYARKDVPGLELSPGTCIFNDAGYADAFPDLVFPPAALLLTRVISRPASDRVTFDLGYKAVASDPPVGKRLTFPDLPDAEQVLQNEEHLVVCTAQASRFAPGDEQFAMPRHICPTVALHRQVYVVSGGRLVDRWDVVARDRWLTI